MLSSPITTPHEEQLSELGTLGLEPRRLRKVGSQSFLSGIKRKSDSPEVMQLQKVNSGVLGGSAREAAFS